MTKYLSNTLVKGLKILEFLKTKEPKSLNEISLALNFNTTTTFRLLATLVEFNYIKKQDKKYFLSSQMDSNYQIKNPLLSWMVVPITKKIVDKYKITAYIGILQDCNVIITQVIPHRGAYNEYNKLGLKAQLNESALGKCIAAYFTVDELEQTIRELKLNTQQSTKYTLDGNSFSKNLSIVRENGYALDDEESTLGIRCLAVPIFKDKKVVASLGVSGSFDKLKRNKLKIIQHELVNCSKEISMQLD